MVQHATFKVYGSCEMCKVRIETAVKSVKSVTNAIWSIKTKRLHVEYNGEQANLDALHRAIAR